MSKTKKLIKSLTDEQQTLLEAYPQKWIDAGLSTKTDRKGARQGINLIYESQGLKPPRIMWFDSLYAGAWAASFCLGNSRLSKMSGNTLPGRYWADGNNAELLEIKRHIGKSVFGGAILDIDDEVGSYFWDTFGGVLGQQIEKYDHFGKDFYVYHRVKEAFFYEVAGDIHEIAKDMKLLGENLNGFSIHFNDRSIPRWAFLSEIAGCACPWLEGWVKLNYSCGGWWTFENLAILTPRPVSLNLDESGRLHNPDGIAIEYPDGWGIYAINGVVLPKDVVLEPNEITVRDIDEQKNVEVRRIMIDRYGVDRYIVDSKAKVIHEDKCGILYRKEVPGDEPVVVVKVINSTMETDGLFKSYFLRVPPNMTRARQAVAWTFGISERKYQPAVQT